MHPKMAEALLALLTLVDTANQIGARIALAQAEGRDISDEELAAAQVAGHAAGARLQAL